jgi:hypothetical protein
MNSSTKTAPIQLNRLSPAYWRVSRSFRRHQYDAKKVAQSRLANIGDGSP